MRTLRSFLIATFTVLVACTGGSDGSAPAGEIVPWIAAKPGGRQATPTPASPERLCSSADLRAEPFGPAGAAAGTVYTSAVVRNVSSTYCAVGAGEKVRFLDDSGRQAQAPERMGAEPGPWVVIPPEKDLRDGVHGAFRTRIRLGIPGVCPPVPASALEITFSVDTSRMSLVIPKGSGTDEPPPECAGGERPGYFAAFVSEAPAPELPPSPLRADIVANGTPRPGEIFRYWVRLSNLEDHDVLLDPCPSYSEGFKGLGDGPEIYLLNCTERNVIPVGATITYEMRIQVPTDLRAGFPFELNWGFLGGSGPNATHVF